MKVILLALVLSLVFVGALQSELIPTADAIKSKGVPLAETHSKKVCGLELCSATKSPSFPAGQIITPENDDPEDSNAPELLFVQTANSGTFVQVDGRNILTLVEISPTTIWFSDRPHRITGQEATDLFAAKWAEGTNSFAINPPNAALDILDGTENSDVIIVELSNPVYSPESETLQYDVIILEEATEGLTHYSKNADATIPTIFAQAALFIDDADLDSAVSSDAIPIPGISQFYGVDITKGISSSPLHLFDFHKDDVTQVQIGDSSYLLPDSLVLDSTDNFDMKSHAYESMDEVKSLLTADVGLSYSSPEVDAEIDAKYTQQSDTSETSYFVIVEAHDKKYQLTVENGAKASHPFNKAVNNLPNKYVGNQEEYFKFFSTFGTHYTHDVEFGGKIEFSSQESDTTSTTLQDFKLSVSASASDIAETVAAHADLEVSKSESSSDSTIDLTVSGSGGDSSLLDVFTFQKSSDSFDAWWASIDDNPGQMNINYAEIHNLVTDPHKKRQLQNAMSDYLRSGFDYDILVTNSLEHYSTTISIGTGNTDSLTFELPTDKKRKSTELDDKLTFGGMLVVTDLHTGELVEKFIVNENPPASTQAFHFNPITDDTIPKIGDRIEHYEQKGNGYLYFVSMFTNFDAGDQTDFLWFEKIGAKSFTDVIAANTGAKYYVLVGYSNLSKGMGAEMIQDAGDDTWTIAENEQKARIANGSNEMTPTPQQTYGERLIGWDSSMNGYDQLNCEFSGNIVKTTRGFTGINGASTNNCS